MAPRLLWEPSHGRDAHCVCASGRTDTKRVGVLSESSSDTPSNPVGPCAFWWCALPGPGPVVRSTGGDPSGTIPSRTCPRKRPNT